VLDTIQISRATMTENLEAAAVGLGAVVNILIFWVK
jgi:hypothetical protein